MFQKYAKLMQRLSGRIQRKRYFNMDSTEGTLIITVLINWLMILASLVLGLRQNSGVPNTKGLRSLLTDIFSGTSCEYFDERYSQLRLPTLGSTSVVPWSNCASRLVEIRKAVIKVRPLFRATFRCTLVSGCGSISFFSDHRNPINICQTCDRFVLV